MAQVFQLDFTIFYLSIKNGDFPARKDFNVSGPRGGVASAATNAAGQTPMASREWRN